jgi:nanoRNase/pAp phosphatase (c-di-AMP/oligoRNAs hydrolase)
MTKLVLGNSRKKMNMNKSISGQHARRILRFLSSRGKSVSPLLILVHNYPDPDSLASAFALSYLVQKAYGIASRIVYDGIIGRTENKAMVSLLKIPIHKLRPKDFRCFQIALLDTQPSFENNAFPKNRRATMVVDQHPFVKKPFADLTVLDPECGATSVLLARTLLQAKIPVPENIATALAYGILSDTLNLYRVGRPDVIQTYLDILKYADLKLLARIQNPFRSRRFFATLGKAIQNAGYRRGLLMVHLGWVENPDLVAQIADFLLTYKEVDKTFCTGRYKGKIHVSLRVNNPNAEAGEILRDIFDKPAQAGGHNGIGGGSMPVSSSDDEAVWQKAESSITEKFLKRIRIPIKKEFHYPFH